MTQHPIPSIQWPTPMDLFAKPVDGQARTVLHVDGPVTAEDRAYDLMRDLCMVCERYTDLPGHMALCAMGSLVSAAIKTCPEPQRDEARRTFLQALDEALKRGIA